MRREWLFLEWMDADGVERQGRLLVRDVVTRDGGEYLVGASPRGERVSVRLDRIRAARRERDGARLAGTKGDAVDPGE
jgi:hypothetical protein